jgi:hypothetical protein
MSGIDEKILEIIMNKDDLYYHCAWHGVVYKDEAKSIPLIDVYDFTGKTRLGNEFKDYKITSGICDSCYQARYKDDR